MAQLTQSVYQVMQSHIVQMLAALEQSTEHRAEHRQVRHDGVRQHGIRVGRSPCRFQRASCGGLETKYPNEMLKSGEYQVPRATEYTAVTMSQ